MRILHDDSDNQESIDTGTGGDLEELTGFFDVTRSDIALFHGCGDLISES
jgi:hypothetical protein